MALQTAEFGVTVRITVRGVEASSRPQARKTRKHYFNDFEREALRRRRQNPSVTIKPSTERGNVKHELASPYCYVKHELASPHCHVKQQERPPRSYTSKHHTNMARN
jgi:hypothetical protein